MSSCFTTFFYHLSEPGYNSSISTVSQKLRPAFITLWRFTIYFFHHKNQKAIKES